MYSRILLVNSPPLASSGRARLFREHPPLGILYLASFARKSYPEIKYRIVDGHLKGFEETLDEIFRFKPDLIGVSFTTPSASGAYRLVQEVKRIFPDAHLVAGGPHPTVMPNESFLKGFDSVVVGEGEKAFLKIIANGTKGVVVGEPIRNLDGIPIPARDLIDMKAYPGDPIARRRPEASYISSRGCYWKPPCTFCSNPCFKNYRIRSPRNVVDEIELLIDEYQMKEFFDQCDEITPNIKWMSKFKKEVKERGLDLLWKCQIRVDSVTENLVKEMAESGCWLVFCGIESGCQETLNGIHKGITLEQVKRSCKLFKEYGIKVFGFFMGFNVWKENNKLRCEGFKESLQTLKYARKLLREKLLDYVGWALTAPYPGSELWDICLEYDLIPRSCDWEEMIRGWHLTMHLPGITEENWKTLKKEALKLQAYTLLRNIRALNLSSLQFFLDYSIEAIKLWVSS